LNVTQDYPKYGIENVADKQRLFKVIKQLNSEARSAPQPPSENGESSSHAVHMQQQHAQSSGTNAGLLDLSVEDSESNGIADAAPAGPPNGLFAAAHARPQHSKPEPGVDGVDEDDGCVDEVDYDHGDDEAYISQCYDNERLELGRHYWEHAGADDECLGDDESQSVGHGSTLSAMEPENLSKIRVVVRKRPLNKKEVSRKEEDIVSMDSSASALCVHEQKQKVDLTTYTDHHDFMFDDIYPENVGNPEVYASAVQPLVKTLFNGGKVTCFAYGQTGSGKTYTMQPLPASATGDILALMARREGEGLELYASFFEIYGGKVFDLLNARNKLVIREDSNQKVNIVGVHEHIINSVDTVTELVEHGNAARSTGQTGANDDSSRSHGILQLTLKKPKPEREEHPLRPRSAFNRKPEKSPKKEEVGKFSFIDLAGSERGADTTDNDKQTRLEGAEINKSLLALKECIRALDLEHKHVPFRGSKLTEVLRDSFVGAQSRTVMIAAISPASWSCEHTLNTLRYAFRVKELRHEGGGGAGPSSVDPHKDSGRNRDAALPGSGTEQPQAAPKQAQQRSQPQQQQQQQTAQPRSSGVPSVPSAQQQQSAPADPKSVPFSQRQREKEKSASPVKPTSAHTQGQHASSAAPVNVRPGRRSGARVQEQVQEQQQQQQHQQQAAPAAHGLEGLTELSRHVGARGRGKSNQENVPPQQGANRNAAVQSAAVKVQQQQQSQLPQSANGVRGKKGKEDPSMTRQAAIAQARSGIPPESEEDKQLLDSAHDELMNTILEEEEEVIGAHRQLIDDTMEQIKREMVLLEEVESPGSQIDAYVKELNELLSTKASAIATLQERLSTFDRHLREEEVLSRTTGRTQADG